MWEIRKFSLCSSRRYWDNLESLPVGWGCGKGGGGTMCPLPWIGLIHRVVTMEYRTSVPTRDRDSACQHTTLFFDFCAWPYVAICINFSFKVKEQLFEHTFCHLIFSDRDTLTVEPLWKSSSPVSTSEIEFRSCRSGRGKPPCTQRSCLVSSQGMPASRG